MNLSAITGVVMDMDGVLWRGDQMLPGVGQFFDFLRGRGLPFVLATNNSSKTPGDYIVKLAGMGVDGVREDQIVTSGTATVDYLLAHYPAGIMVHVVGGAGLKTLVTNAGFVLSDADAQVVVVGIDTNLTYETIKRAMRLIRAGADFIGTNGDLTIPVADGLAPGAGSILAAIAACAGRQPLVIGKPNKPSFEAALHILDSLPEATLMIGDRLDTDIQGAQAAGLRAALVLTGVTTRETLAASAVKPDAVYEGLLALMAAWD
ncbi:MAG: HAD-IIA family hydrolase [Anaerolineae bacterium]|nr:HAD-IIA family hydrolase [Anaerolineae bacterium]